MTPRARTLVFLCLMMSCSDSQPGRGTLEITAYGEAFVEAGIAASEVRDGWAIDFSRFEVSVRDVLVAGQSLPGPVAVDLVEPSDGQGQRLGALSVPAGPHADASFTVASVHVSGSARKAGHEKRFDWRFDQPVRYRDCESTTEVPDGGSGALQITMHADHFLYDSLVAEEPSLTFQALADADTGDGEITAEELAAADLGALDPGNLQVEDLWGWLNALARTLAHVDGEGHCHSEPAE